MRRGRWLSCLLVATVAAHAWVGSATGQEVEFRRGTRGLPIADAALRRVLERGRYQVWVRDTILAETERVAEDVILLGATLRVEGRIEGDLVAVQSDVFARPGGMIAGSVIVLGGGFYGSSLAKLGAPPLDASVYDYTVEEREVGRYVITAPGGHAELRLTGLRGFSLPSYDRVNALTLGWGLALDGGNATGVPSAIGQLRFRSARTAVDGDVALIWPVGRHALALNGGRSVRSNDRWINAEVANSLTSLLAAGDYRNYYEATFIEAGVRLAHGTRSRWGHRLDVGWERARSLESQDPFSISSLRSGFKSNLEVDEADVASLRWTSSASIWTGESASIEIEVSFEAAERDVAGDLSYTLFGGGATIEIGTYSRHSLVIIARGQAPGSTSAPRQRWRTLGGWGTLPTLEPVARSGDHMWWVEATYRIPSGMRLSLLGELVPWIRYAVGNAWIEGARRPAVAHNVGLGANLGLMAAGLYTDPAADFDTVFLLGFTAGR